MTLALARLQRFLCLGTVLGGCGPMPARAASPSLAASLAASINQVSPVALSLVSQALRSLRVVDVERLLGGSPSDPAVLSLDRRFGSFGALPRGDGCGVDAGPAAVSSAVTALLDQRGQRIPAVAASRLAATGVLYLLRQTAAPDGAALALGASASKPRQSELVGQALCLPQYSAGLQSAVKDWLSAPEATGMRSDYNYNALSRKNEGVSRVPTPDGATSMSFRGFAGIRNLSVYLNEDDGRLDANTFRYGPGPYPPTSLSPCNGQRLRQILASGEAAAKAADPRFQALVLALARDALPSADAGEAGPE